MANGSVDGPIGWLGWLLARFPILAPAIPAFFAIWWLLPKGRAGRPGVGLAAGAFALVVGWINWVHSTSSGLYDLLFCLFAAETIIAAALMITQSNPVYAALWFALVILGSTGLFFLLSAPFLAASTIIVYAGAIIVTFLFVIMLAQQSGLASYDRRSQSPLGASIAGFLMILGLLYAFEKTYASPESQMALQANIVELEATLARVDDLEKSLAELSQATEGGATPLADVMRGQLDQLPEPARRQQAAAKLDTALKRWEQDLAAAKLGDRLAELKSIAKEMQDEATLNLERQGFLTTTMSGRASRLAAEKVERLDYSRVAGLGQALFGEYLWAVEMAGTLLMVAIIGAIAIAPARGQVAS